MWLVNILFLCVTTILTHPIIPEISDQVLITEALPILESTISEDLISDRPVARLIPINVDPSIDTNEDGVLDVDEVRYAAFVHHGLSASVVEDMFKQVDQNHDSVLDAREFDSIRSLVLEKAENAALRYLQNVDIDRDGLLSLQEAQTYLLREYGIGYRDATRLWKLVTPNIADRMNATLFSRLRRRVRGMTIRLARAIMKTADVNGDGHISTDEAQAIAFEQEGIGAGDVASMVASVDENMDGELNAPEFADFERIVRARALENSKKAMSVVDADNSGTLTLDEAKRVAFEHYGFDEDTLIPFFGQADENEDGQLDIVEFAGFRSVIRARSVKDATEKLKRIDSNGDGLISTDEAIEMTKKEDDMEPSETVALFNIADQNKSGKLDKVEFADFNRLVRLSSIKFAADHFKEFDLDGNDAVTFDEIALLIEQKYGIPRHIIKTFFDQIDVDKSEELNPAEIVDFRHLIRNHVSQQRQEKPSTIAPAPVDVTTTPLITTTSSQSQQQLDDIDDVIDGIGNDVIAQDIAMEKLQQPVTSTSTIPTLLTIQVEEEVGTTVTVPSTTTTTTTTTTTHAPSTTVTTTLPSTTPATSTSSTTTASSSTSSTTAVPTTTTTVENRTTTTTTTTTTPTPTKLSRKTTKKNLTTTTITTTTTTKSSEPEELVVEEVVYVDENGHTMTPQKVHGQKNEDVSYEEVIEYVDEPESN